MKVKALLTAVLLASVNIAMASGGGGLSIDNVKQHMGAGNYVSTLNSPPQINVQGPIDQFNADSSDRDRKVVTHHELKQSYDGRS